MSNKSNKGFLVHVYHTIGELIGNTVKLNVADGEIVNIYNSVYHRTYIDKDGVYHLDGIFERKDHVIAHLYKCVGQKVQSMLQNGWRNIEVTETRDEDGEIYVEVFAKSGSKGWKDVFSVVSANK